MIRTMDLARRLRRDADLLEGDAEAVALLRKLEDQDLPAAGDTVAASGDAGAPVIDAAPDTGGDAVTDTAPASAGEVSESEATIG